MQRLFKAAYSPIFLLSSLIWIHKAEGLKQRDFYVASSIIIYQ